MYNKNAVQSAFGLSEIPKGHVVKYDHAIEHHEFDLDMYTDVRDMSPIFTKTLSKGESKLKTFPNLSEDIFMNLFKWNPKVRDASQMMPSKTFNYNLLNELNQTDEFKALRSKCRVDLMNSAIGSEIMQNDALVKIDEAIEEYKLKRQRRIEQGENPANIPENLFDELNNMQTQEGKNSNPVDGDDPGHNGGAGGGSLSPEQAKALADQLAQMQTASDVNQAKEQIKKALQESAKKALDDVQELDDFMESWGIGDDDSNVRVSIDETRSALERIRASNELKELSKILGMFRNIAKSSLKQKSTDTGYAVKSVTVGNDIVKILPTEKGLLINETTKKMFHKKYSEKQLLQYSPQNKKRKGQGPIIVAVDKSGSMEGECIRWAKAVALGLLEVAAKQKRNFYIMFFNGAVKEEWHFINGEAQPSQIIDIAEVGVSGGTNFNKPVQKCLKIIDKEKNFKKADICFITDGDCSISGEYLDELLETKKRKKIKIQTVVIDIGGHCSVGGVKDWSDEIRRVSNMADLQGSLASDIFNMSIDDE